MYLFSLDQSDFNRKYILLRNSELRTDYIISAFLEIAKVDPDKYAGKMLSGIISNFFIESEDLEHQYNNYYSKEYDSFEDYLFKNMLLDEDEISWLQSKLKSSEKMFYVDLRNLPTNNDSNLFDYEEEDFMGKINKILEEIA